MGEVKRALLMASGANRGAFYAGFGGVFDQRSVGFDLMAGISAGALASAWFAAGQYEDVIESWREATGWRISPHPILNSGRRVNVDELIQQITLKMMRVDDARTSQTEVLMGAARVTRWRTFRLPVAQFHVFSNREAHDQEHFGLMIRATSHVPVMNGLRAAVAIDGGQYLDGGLVARVPFEMVPEDRYDEIWVAACSPHGLQELEGRLAGWSRPERLVVVTPSTELPVNRWTLDWGRLRDTIDIGRADMESAIAAASSTPDHVFIGRRADTLRGLVSD